MPLATEIMGLQLEPREQVIRALLYFTGLRVSPLCNLRVCDVSYGSVTIEDQVFPGTLKATVKGNKPQVIPMHPELRSSTTRWPATVTCAGPRRSSSRRTGGRTGGGRSSG
jgi:integrase